ncbi:aminotransferase-like domain-containing protein [Micromonospora sagamiensis]|uniref:(S)-3,5-dihydroxyphenylglycine transaminase n=1 Tax=Micromonospora sagamiensis TaxID=47875 RepID=A0A562WFL9_9ACTN|nr:PLP-dependent aminotransferase family protein [Micromonospora sagamiensis]TWJ29063.1 (S)-3,5-dihydroxyphenylglycine transaminase [Micromonospora sagamiensis]BCL17912.1 aminotransferase [Micromonospora sagamiensis]
MSPPAADVDLRGGELFAFLSSPQADTMNFLNEIALRFPDAVSFAAGRPHEGFFSVDLIRRYLDTYTEHLLREYDRDETRVCQDLLQYGRTKGLIHDLVAKSLSVDEGIEVDPDSIVVTVGAQEGLYLVLRALRRTAGDAILAVQPGYVGLTGAAELVDMPVLPVRGGPGGVDLTDLGDTLRRARTDGLNPRALYLNTDFANPTGHSLSRAAREELLRAAEDSGILLIEDNPYGIFGPERENPPTLKALDRSRRVVYVGSFAKSGFPGARVGYVVADQRVDRDGRHESLADQLARIKSMLTVNTSPIGQAVIGGKLLENGFSMRAANKREIDVYQRNLRQLLDGLAAHFPAGSQPEVTWNSPDGGFFLLLNVPFEAGDDVLERSAREHGVLWTPIHHFYGDGRPRRQIRLSFSHLSPAEIDEGLRRLAGFVRS